MADRRPRTHDGRGFPSRERRTFDGLRLRGLEFLRRDLVVHDPSGDLRFRCETGHEYNRASHLFVQEPGTVEWLRRTLRSGDVFYDVGANIGTFTLLAARAVGAEGRVCAFEPHVATLTALMHNLVANDLHDRTDVLACALHDGPGWLPFHYRSIAGGSGMSQLAATKDPFGRDQSPVISELKPATSVDRLVAGEVLRAPTVVKIDVDGNEAAILKGMTETLTAKRIRSLQVEVNPDTRETTLAFLEGVGYRLVDEHRTRGGQRLIDEGEDPATIGFNGVFEPAG